MRERVRLRARIAVPLRRFTLEADLDVGPETVALLGPSGAGKSTALAAIAGFVTPARGRIALDGRVLFDAAAGVNLPPEERNVGLVPQDYALFPHLSVFENVAFGLRCRRLPASTVRERVAAALSLVGLAREASARPAHLSGGERQRVALARALVVEPEALLLDEPLSALDPATRRRVRAELGEILARLGVPVLLVTHDAEDAAALADRTIPVQAGRIGAPSFCHEL